MITCEDDEKGGSVLKKVFLCVLFILAMCFSATVSTAEVTILSGAQNVPGYMIDELVNRHGEELVLVEYGEIAQENDSSIVSPSSVIILPGLTTFEVDSKQTTVERALAKDEFIISVAYGMTVTLNETAEYELTCSISGPASAAELGIETVVRRTFSVTYEWKGPDAPYNTCEYRISFFERRGTYTGHYNYLSYLEPKTDSGTWSEPLSYLIYQVPMSYYPPSE